MVQFEVGKYYRYTGPTGRGTPGGWNERMAFVFDGEPHQCLWIRDWDNDVAKFENPLESEEENKQWDWGVYRECWEEVEPDVSKESRSDVVGTRIIFERRK